MPVNLAFRPGPKAGAFDIPILLVSALDIEQELETSPIRVSASSALMPWRNVSRVVKESSDSRVELKQATEAVATANGPSLGT